MGALKMSLRTNIGLKSTFDITIYLFEILSTFYTFETICHFNTLTIFEILATDIYIILDI